MTRIRNRSGLSLAVFGAMACGGLWLAPATLSGVSVARAAAAVGMCPPSEGELDLEGYDLSGDGLVQLPQGVRWRVLPSETKSGVAGTVKRAFGVGESGKVTLVLEDPARDNRRIMTMRLTAVAASEVKEWLGDALDDQQRFIAARSYAEKPGMLCAVDAKQCKAAAEKNEQRLAMPRMYVSISSRGGTTQHGWSMMPRDQREGGGSAAASKDDQRIAITAYQTGGLAPSPLSVKMDVATAKKLAADLGTAMAGETPEDPKPAPDQVKPEKETGTSGV